MKLSHKTESRLKEAYGDWVLVTGATSGIGKAMATKFAEAGFNLVITGRRESALNDLSTAFFDRYQVEVIPITGDLSQTADVQSLLSHTSHLPIGIVVLNAGFGTSGKFIKSDIEDEINLLDVNCRAVLCLAHHFANKMIMQPNRGAVVMLSSIVAFQGVPNAAHYAATKAYVQTLGEGIERELKPLGVDVLCAAPGPVESGFAERANMKMNPSLTPDQVAVPIIEAIGKKTKVLPGFMTKFLVYNLSLLPRWLKIRVMGEVMSGFTQHQN